MQLSQNLVVFAGLACVVQGAFWTDILKGIQNAGRYKNFFDAIGDVTDELLSDEGEAATFICEIIHGDIPDVVEALPSAVVNEVEGDFQALTSFVGGLPSLVPEVFSEIVQGGEVVVSIVEEIVTAPGEALTVVEDGVVSVWSDITAGAASVVDDVTHFIGCGIFNEGCSDSTSFTDNGILERCSSVLEGVSSSAVSFSTATPTSTSVVLLTTSAATPGSSLQTTLPTQTAVDTTNLLDVTPSSTLAINATSTSVPASTNTPPINGVGKENGNLKFATIALGFTFMFLL
ncbi:hypothetical protein F4821DRAFT_244916 [Hypoxylon rubiginosum]|uniref:Uncharacterized protein n=1 Tax=Hypoxylon rubiginosum TaxID=110542 RepID=A0ACC0CTK8_9PEZI|nr:hypothetical protein F4821DRAFT_244916 [Hypoxylon rubiginosum]